MLVGETAFERFGMYQISLIVKHLYDDHGIEPEVMYRSLSFIYKVYNSTNSHIRFCAQLIESSRTSVANNRRLIMSHINCNSLDWYQGSLPIMKAKIRKSYECNNECLNVGQAVKELCLLRDGVYHYTLSSGDTISLLHFICVH